MPGLGPRLSGTEFCLYERTTLIPYSHPTFVDATGREEVNAVPHQNSVFHAMLKLLPWGEFDQAVERHGATTDVRGFSFKSQLAAMLYAQLSGAASLREIETGLRSHADRLYHLGVSLPHRSTLADANRQRPVGVFTALLGGMIQSAHRRLRRTMDGVSYLIDSTGLALNERRPTGRGSRPRCAAPSCTSFMIRTLIAR